MRMLCICGCCVYAGVAYMQMIRVCGQCVYEYSTYKRDTYMEVVR